MARGLAALVAIVLLLSAVRASAQALVLHHGSADPVTEGWTLAAAGAGSSQGPLDDAGVPTWFLATTLQGVGIRYSEVLTPTELTAITDEGWVLTVVARLVTPNVPVHYNILSVSGPVRSFPLKLGSLADGTPFAWLDDGFQQPFGIANTYTLTGGAGAYHRFDLVYDTSTARANLLVDGVTRLFDYGGYANFNPAFTPGNVGWSAGSSVGVSSQLNYAHIELRAGGDLPVPATPTTWGAVKALYLAD